MRKRVRFTQKELNLIIEMIGIAGDGVPEGDYRDWDRERKYETMNSLEDRVLELMVRVRDQNCRGQR